MKILSLLLMFCLCVNAKENLHSLLKMQLTKEEYLATLQTMKRKGLVYCINTFKSDGKVLQDMTLAEQSLSIEQEFTQTFYRQYPQLSSMKNAWNVNKTGKVVFEYIKRYINVNIPFMAYYQTYAPYNKFPISIQEANNIDYINSFLQEPIIENASYFIPCMQLYDSKEYQEYLTQVIDIIICKNCKKYKTPDVQKYQTIYDEIVNLAKMQGFARCIVHYQENNTRHTFSDSYDKVTNDIQGGYFLLSRFLSNYNHRYEQSNISQEIDWYVHKIMQTYTKENDTTHLKAHQIHTQQPRILDCLAFYDSKEYQAEVKRIVKKYCKECK